MPDPSLRERVRAALIAAPPGTEVDAVMALLEQVGWGGCTAHRVIECNDEDGHEWHLVHEDGTGQLDDEHPIWPVYRLTGEAST